MHRWEIPSRLHKEWVKVDTLNQFAPRSLDVECPTAECRRSLVSINLKWTRTGHFMWAYPKCNGCNQKVSFFLLNPPQDNDLEARENSRIYLFPKPSVSLSLEPGIEEI